MFERFSKDARQVILTTVQTAAELGAGKAAPEHLLLCLAAAPGIGGRVLAGYGVTAASLQAATAGTNSRAGLTDEEISALRAVGIDADEVFRRIEEAFGPEAFDDVSPPQPEQRKRRGLVGGVFDQQAKKVMELSLREAVALGHREISTEHFLLALLRQGVVGPMSTVLAERGVTYDDAKQRVLAERARVA